MKFSHMIILPKNQYGFEYAIDSEGNPYTRLKTSIHGYSDWAITDSRNNLSNTNIYPKIMNAIRHGETKVTLGFGQYDIVKY